MKDHIEAERLFELFLWFPRDERERFRAKINAPIEQIKQKAMNKNQATKKKAEWLAYCLEIGFIEKSQLDELSAIWDKYKDENGNIIAGSQWQAKQVEQPAKNEPTPGCQHNFVWNDAAADYVCLNCKIWKQEIDWAQPTPAAKKLLEAVEEIIEYLDAGTWNSMDSANFRYTKMKQAINEYKTQP